MINNIKINMKKMALLIGLSTVLMTGCSKKHMELKTTYNSNKEITVFDELYSEESIEKLEELIKYIQISEKIHSMRFERTPIENIKENYTLASIDYIEQLIQDKNYEELNIQEQLVNNYIYSRGYDIVYMACKKLLEAKELDVLGFDETAEDHITINEKKSGINDPESRYIDMGVFKVEHTSSLGNLYLSMYEMNNKGYAYGSTKKAYSYNKDRNELILRAIDRIVSVIPIEYKATKKGVLKAK